MPFKSSKKSGEIGQLVPEARRAWHAGVSCWEGETDINSRSIGIEISNGGHSLGYPDFPDTQIDAVIALCRDILAAPSHPRRPSARAFRRRPRRKIDPGEKFPWERLHSAGIGMWVARCRPHRPRSSSATAARPSSSSRTRSLRYGFGIKATGIYDEATVAMVTAFQRHFRCDLVDGRADRSTVDALEALLVARDDEIVARRKVVARR